jgi:hypothetical protein
MLEDYILHAQYRCQKCGHEWTQRAEPVECRRCGHLYVTWLNHPLTLDREASECHSTDPNSPAPS